MSPKVLIVMGSDSDCPVLEETAKILEQFAIPFEMRIASAHRSPRKTADLVEAAAGRGIQVIIAAAGLAAHLPGVVAAGTILPVIGVPMGGGPLNGVDALYAIVQMPAGIPVATTAIGRTGARNAALLAAQILALSDPTLSEKLLAFRERMACEIEEKDQKLQRRDK
ncbi:MAG: 5-(carboxyamino)imidazole ribonucleotide mutase [Syntrophotalea acetylenica]|jgi:5-(carboxyamino)imidazole ribonucleotide mutase|uniref:N5-carboxyaminoimidazole ribonucleotide mutase n=1 Tax=Syntrophotalea acetylenica TaxID=29542 RepID=A0A1L3GD17_SYNAC|nr:5-(carboxyamino)imidazole ribonucleotide mutase [Syntrophotalea acetylenica]APG23844.1 5-(carboxyamino)imidazole ribonucleotide mutase [Syntrophotalea acetylenica]APG44425.1 5-(carboxyamino)imidazole ribonucleotide mutase [Syntrophotalea acetylenica]MDD4457907.1 5-(carboxyamino)imidazole ribonucleotide mutase [Syntrophotalea acetylenica]MDY0261606.1 5-(carboxyamino)imidazole ribonucleotide mutase [Syntrophotalea acetylenica]